MTDHQVAANDELRTLNDAEIAAASGAAQCTVDKVIFDIGWLGMGWGECGGEEGIVIYGRP